MKYLSLLLLFFIGCDDTNEDDSKEKYEVASKVIIDAYSLRYDQLEPGVKSETADGSFFLPVGNPFIAILKDTSYYVVLVLNNKNLAHISTDRGRSPDSTLIDSTNFYELYGKYRNSLQVYDKNGIEMPRVEKHGGANIISIKRNKDIDTVFYGPIPIYPNSIELSCSDLDSLHPARKLRTCTEYVKGSSN